MTGGQRYWNEDAQRWEDAGGAGSGSGAGSGASVTPPPPPPPSFQPVVPTSAPGGVTDPDAPAGGGWSVPEPPKPGASGAGRRRMVWGVLGGAAAVGVAVALVLSLVVGDDGGGGGADDRAGGPGTSAPQESSPTPEGESEAVPTKTSTTGSPSADPSALPEGYELHQDAEGFTIARPTGWERETVPSQHGFDVVNYRSPDGFRRLQVYEIAESSPEESFELYLSEDTPKPDGFQQVEMVPLDAGVEGVRLEYLADSLRGEPEVGSWHVQDVRFRSPEDGKVYAVAAYGAPTDGVDPELELVLVAVEHFCPPSATCG
ncbi:hypothetical protein ABT368_02570 [Streptomyces althioticus]|uniref:hypothetical protein n=1 Tax=Streptomyces althioticus TaxID=83380 RepID=UPI001874C822|nr:hypothetical protein GCM10010243_05220 [Streptomyces matensis]